MTEEEGNDRTNPIGGHHDNGLSKKFVSFRKIVTWFAVFNISSHELFNCSFYCYIFLFRLFSVLESSPLYSTPARAMHSSLRVKVQADFTCAHTV